MTINFSVKTDDLNNSLSIIKSANGIIDKTDEDITKACNINKKTINENFLGDLLIKILKTFVTSFITLL